MRKYRICLLFQSEAGALEVHTKWRYLKICGYMEALDTIISQGGVLLAWAWEEE